VLYGDIPRIAVLGPQRIGRTGLCAAPPFDYILFVKKWQLGAKQKHRGDRPAVFLTPNIIKGEACETNDGATPPYEYPVPFW